MAVRTHALLALMLVDLRFSPLFERSHGRCSPCGFGLVPVLVDDFVEGVFHNPLGTQRFQPRDDEAHSRLRNDSLHGYPVAPRELGNGG